MRTKAYPGTTPKVWIGCLASYNAGRLIGEWVDATDLDEMYECQKRVAAQAVRAAKEAGEYPVYFGEPEEFFLADHEGFPEDAIGEYTPLSTVARIAEAVEEHGEALAAYMALGIEAADADIDDTVANFQEAFRGEYDSLKDYAYDHVRDCGLGDVPPGELTVGPFGEHKVNVLDALESYIDWDTVARELEHSGYSEVTVEPSYTTYVFCSQ